VHRNSLISAEKISARL